MDFINAQIDLLCEKNHNSQKRVKRTIIELICIILINMNEKKLMKITIIKRA